jgi:recombination protein RecT
MEQTPQELLARPQGMVKEAGEKLTDFLARYRNQIVQILPKHLTPERVLKLIVGELNRSPALMGCSPMSVVNCCLHAASMGLEIRPRSAYIVPFGKEATLMLDYRAKIELALRSGYVSDMEARLVYAGDDFELSFGIEPKLLHVPRFESEKIAMGYAIAWSTKARKPHVEVMTYAQIDAIRKRSKMAEGPAWKNHYDQMARKTLIHRLSNYIPQSPEIAHSQDIDDLADQGKPLPSFIDVDPEDAKPMIDASPEERERVMKEKMEEVRQHDSEKKAPRKVQVSRIVKDSPARELAKVYDWIDDAPDPIDCAEGEHIYVGKELYEQNEERSAWRRVQA